MLCSFNMKRSSNRRFCWAHLIFSTNLLLHIQNSTPGNCPDSLVSLHWMLSNSGVTSAISSVTRFAENTSTDIWEPEESACHVSYLTLPAQISPARLRISTGNCWSTCSFLWLLRPPLPPSQVVHNRAKTAVWEYFCLGPFSLAILH